MVHFCAQFCARNFASITAMAASWEKNLRRLIKDTHGQGWSLRQKVGEIDRVKLALLAIRAGI